jgi:hypothetical protein
LLHNSDRARVALRHTTCDEAAPGAVSQLDWERSVYALASADASRAMTDLGRQLLEARGAKLVNAC